MSSCKRRRPLEGPIDRGQLIFMVILIGLLLFLPLMPAFLATSIFLLTILLAAWLVSADRPRSRRVILGLLIPIVAIIAVAVTGFRLSTPLREESVRLLLDTLVLALLVYCCAKIIGSLLSAEEVTAREIVGSANFFLVMGFIWTFVYSLVWRLDHGAFSVSPLDNDASLRLTYFSFVTLTTLGYGDIVPQTPFAKMLVVLEAIMGQLYVAVVVAYLLSLHVSQRLTGKDD